MGSLTLKAYNVSLFVFVKLSQQHCFGLRAVCIEQVTDVCDAVSGCPAAPPQTELLLEWKMPSGVFFDILTFIEHHQY